MARPSIVAAGFCALIACAGRMPSVTATPSFGFASGAFFAALLAICFPRPPALDHAPLDAKRLEALIPQPDVVVIWPAGLQPR